MTRGTGQIDVIATGVDASIAIGILGARGGMRTDQPDDHLCATVASVQASIARFAAMSPASGPESAFRGAESRIEHDWNEVRRRSRSARDVKLASLDSAWADVRRDWARFEEGVKGVPWGPAVSDALGDVTTSAQAFSTKVRSTYARLEC